MDLAYDHIAQESLPRDEDGRDHSSDAVASPQASLNSDIQAAYSAFSATASPWASRIGGFFGNFVKQVSLIKFCPSPASANPIGRICLPRSTAGGDCTRSGRDQELVGSQKDHCQPHAQFILRYGPYNYRPGRRILLVLLIHYERRRSHSDGPSCGRWRRRR